MYYVWVVLLILGNMTAWCATLFGLPGNWCIVALTALFAFLLPETETGGVSWTVVAVVAGLAVVGEIIEFAAGAAGAAKEGASRRAILLSIIGTVVGSIGGAIIGVPVPVVGSIIAAIGGGCLGAFTGAYLGETWKGRTATQSVNVGRAAMVGRLLGTVGKLAVGAIMVVVSAIAALV